MKRLYGVIVLLWLCSSTGWAQKAFIFNSLQKNGFISIAAGTSLPIGQFSRLTNIDDINGGGMAVSGHVFSVSGGYRLAGPMGLMARYEETQHEIKPAALLTNYNANSLGDALKVTRPAGREGQWQSRSVMAGPYLTVPLGRVALDFRAMAGIGWATCPETCVQGTLNWRETAIRSENQESRAIASNLGFTLRYRITPAIGLHASTDYNSAHYRFNNILLETRTGDVTTTTTYNTTRQLRMVNFSVGLTVQFRSKNRVF